MRTRTFLFAVLTALGVSLLGFATPALAQGELCPSDNPVVQENNCAGAGSSDWRLTNVSNDIGGFATKGSVNLGENVQLKIGRANAFSGSTVDVQVYRMGYYDNTGARLIAAASQSGVPVNNTFSGCSATDATTGLKSCSGWNTSLTIPGAALPASGVYTAKITEPVSGAQNSIVFTVRDDTRAPKSRILFALPTSSYEAYNDWGGKSLYFDTAGGPETISGDRRAVKVSFDRPMKDPLANNRFYGVDFYMIQWLEKQGYDVSYTDDFALHATPSQLLGHSVALISGHSEYWSGEQFDGFLAARNAGVNIASFSSNTAYWKVRYENGGRTLVCYKTVQGSGSTGSGQDGANDWGPDGLEGTADDALGLDGLAGTADDRPENATTTFRDNGAPPGDPNAPEGGRVGPDKPENMLFGSMYYGAELAAGAFPLTITPTNAQSEFAGDRIWRNTGIAAGSSTTIGSNLVGWEWDAVPTQAQYLAKQPAGVKRLTNTTLPSSSNIDWLQDEGRVYTHSPPPGQGSTSQAVKYTAPSGALVFSSGTNNWANALAPNADGRIIQATYNILSDMGVQPGTPTGLTLDPPSGPQPPTASFTVSPNPVQTGETVTFDGSSSTDPDGGIARYEWDLDGNGSYETDGGASPVTTRSYASTGVLTIRLRVTDEQGERSSTTRALSIDNSGTGNYPSRVLGTTGLLSYWRMGETSGNTLVDAIGSSNATTAGAPSLGAAGALADDPDSAVSFDGLDDAASANVNLSTTNKVTIEFWMKWDAFANDDDLAMEFTSNFNSNAGGFLIDPNAPQEGGKFGVAIGNGSARNNAFFARPSAGAWHHYAIVLDAAASAANQIVPYVDGQAVPYTKTASGTGAGTFANSQLFFMSRAAGSLFGAGDLDELAVYTRALDPATIAAHYAGNPQPPTASFTVSADPAAVGQSVTFDGSASTTPSGSITKYDWDLDGDGSFETDTGSNPVATRTYTSPGAVSVKLRVTNSAGDMAQAEQAIMVEQPGSGSYSERILNTAGLTNYWRMNDLTGTTLGDSKGGAHASISGGPALGAPGAMSDDPGTSVRFNGTTSAATANLDLSGTNKLTLEFWMKWNAFADDDDLAFELTPNFNANAGGFLVDPNAPEDGGKFAVGLGNGGARNTAYFNRPSAGAWHHYALVLDTSAAATDQIKPYVDGELVPFNKTMSGTGAGNFANSQLYFMSRAASALFGAGDLDEVAIYNRALSAATISDHFSGSSGAPGESPTASFTAAPNPAPTGQSVSFDGAGSSDPDGSIVKYEWDLDGNGSFETDTGGSASASRSYASPGTVDVRLRVTDNDGATATTTRTLTVQNRPPTAAFSAAPNPAQKNQTVSFDGSGSGDPDGTIAKYEWDLDGNGSFETDTGTAATTSRSYASAGPVEVRLRVTDSSDATTSATRTVTVLGNPPTASFTASPNPVPTGQAVSFDGSGSSDPEGAIAKYEWDLDGNGSFETDTGATATSSRSYAAAGSVEVRLRVTDGDGETASASRTVTVENRGPTASFTVTPSPAATRQTVTFDGSGSSDPEGTIAEYAWDLDANGSYETAGPGATTTRVFDTLGARTIGLRVTDSNGAAATTTRSLTVNSAYRAAVLATPGISDYWRLDDSGTSAVDSNGGNNNGAYVNGPAATGALIAGEQNGARAFDGSNDHVDLSPSPFGTPSRVSAEAWVRTTATKPAGGYHYLITNSSSERNNGFSLAIDSSNRAVFVLARTGLLGNVTRGEAISSVTLAPNTTHHVVGTWDGSRARVYVDGVERANVAFSGSVTWSGGRDLRLGRAVSSAGTQFHLQGALDEAAIYTQALSAATVTAHWNAGRP